MAYGISGSGKSYTIDSLIRSWTTTFFLERREPKIHIGAVEIGPGAVELRDLIEPSEWKQYLLDFLVGTNVAAHTPSVRFNTAGGYTLRCSMKATETPQGVNKVLQTVGKGRSTQATLRNSTSSRSHCIYVLETSSRSSKDQVVPGPTRYMIGR